MLLTRKNLATHVHVYCVESIKGAGKKSKKHEKVYHKYYMNFFTKTSGRTFVFFKAKFSFFKSKYNSFYMWNV